MRNTFARVASAVLLTAAMGTAPALAGGALESIDITGIEPSPIPGQVVARLVPIKWDARCIPVGYKMNSTLDPIPNPLGAPFLSLAAATAALQQSFDPWNNIKTSYINMQITGTVSNPGLAGFDMVNELTFRTAAGFTAIASSPSVTLIADSGLVDGDDIDGDGDSDVSSAIAVCGDVDADGDFEFPAGFYEAGTILDNDVQYNTKASNGFRFTVADADADAVTRSVDLRTTATHENGHSHGLSHVLINQISGTDGGGATMYPFIDTGDPAAELSQRTLDRDDIAWSSYFYPEGTAGSGPAALQPGDIPFWLAYGLIRGTVTHGVFDEPVAGASVFATNLLNGQLYTTGYSGTSQLSYDPVTGDLFLVDPSFNIVDGKYVLPVPTGLWKVGVEAVDGNPVPAGSVSFNAIIGSLFGQHDFNEEFYNGPFEGAIEENPGFALPVATLSGFSTGGIDIVTNDQANINNFGAQDFVGFTGAAPGTYYAVQFPASQVDSVFLGEDYLIHAGAFHTTVLDSSVVPRFAKALLTTGTVTGTTATLDLARPLARVNGFIGQENDFTPLYFPSPTLLSHVVRAKIASGQIQNLFLVLQIPTTAPFPGVSGFPPLIGLDGGVAVNDVPIFGTSYTSTDGVTFNRNPNFNYRFSLILSEKP